MRVTTLLSVVTLTLIAPNTVWARSELDSRVTRLENIVANELNIKLLNQLDVMQQEIRELRGKLEEQQNSVQTLNQKQEKLFLNLDARLNKLDPSGVKASEMSDPNPNPQDTNTQAGTSAPVAHIEMPLSNAQQGTNEKVLYDAAVNLMHARKYEDAILEFKDLLWQFPEGNYAANAYFWLGELYAQQWRENNKSDKNLLAQAYDAFNIVTNKSGGQDLEGDAMLKIALLEIDQDHLAVAKEILQQVAKKFPNTSRALVAENNIALIEKARIDN